MTGSFPPQLLHNRRMEQAGALTLELQALLSVSPARTFELLTDPLEIPRWWGPHGFSTPEIELDLRVAGTYRFTMQPPEGDAFHLRGEFTTIDPGTRLAYTFVWEEPDPDDVATLVALTLQPVDGGTEVLLQQGPFTTQERLDLHRDGWSDGFERLAALTR
jgi:uncharacterized protein YndB with AHSA1/START domain